MCVTVPRTSRFLVSTVSSALICLTSKNRIRSVCRGVPALANGRRSWAALGRGPGSCAQAVGPSRLAARMNETPRRRIGLDMVFPDRVWSGD